MIRDSSLEKMSEILLEYTAPFLDIIDIDNKAEYERALTISIVFWNCSVMGEAGSTERKKVEKLLKPMMSDAESIDENDFATAI